MASGFTYCPNCGTSSTLAGQKFCATCGATLPEAAAAAAPVAAAAAAPAAWGAAQPPAQAPAWGAPPPPAQPPAWGTPPPAQPPAWGGPPPGSVQPWGMQTPPPAKNNTMLFAMLIIGGLLILALVGVGVILATGGSKGTPGPSSAPSVVAQASSSDNTATATPGKTSKATKTPVITAPPATDSSVIITPDTASCSGTSVNMAFAWTLSGSVPGSTKIVVEFDGSIAGTLAAVSSIMTKGADGNWHSNGHVASTDACTALGVGDHTVGLQDSTGTVLVEGNFSLLA